MLSLRRGLAAASLLLVMTASMSAEDTKPAAKPGSPDPSSKNITIRGRIVWMGEALQRRYGVKTVAEAQQRVLALETASGRLYPLVEDVRGRAFRRDERLRKLKDVELLVRRFEDAPMVQIIRLYTHENRSRYELDYWCEICAIAMFELKACDCCQGPIELRRRKSTH